MQVIPNKWRNRWSSEEIQVLVLASLAIQTGLTFLAPLRKRTANKLIILGVWFLYMTADYVATLALGVILSKQTDNSGGGGGGTIPGELTALWAPFLLLHLGGPDTITSYSVEDNEIWWRHFSILAVQVITAAFIFLQSLPNSGLWIPTVLVFFAGLIKFAERTLALRSGSMNNLKSRLISELGPRVPLTVDYIYISSNPSEEESEIVIEGYGWFNIIKRLLVDIAFSKALLMEMQNRFADLSTREVIKMVEIELSFLYDSLHTKAVTIHCKLGRALRCFSLCSIISALIVFHHLDMKMYAFVDIIITYILFIAGLILEVIASVLLLFSDWTVVSLARSKSCSFFARAVNLMVKGTLRGEKPRWSRTIGQYNVIGLCLRDRDTLFGWIMKKLKVKNGWDNMCETKLVPIPILLEEAMFTEAKRRAQNMHTADNNIYVSTTSYRGSKALALYGQLMNLEWSIEREFDESIILWHVATDICYYKDSSYLQDQNESERVLSWKVSNYLVYILTQQPSMMQLSWSKVRIEYLCAMVKRIYRGRGNLERETARRILLEQEALEREKGDQLDFREEGDQLDFQEEGDPLNLAILPDARRLVHELERLDRQLKWQLVRNIWMEMLGYAAIHCDPNQHAKTLCRGGELLTHMWWLMAQMGVVLEHKVQRSRQGRGIAHTYVVADGSNGSYHRAQSAEVPNAIPLVVV